MEVPGGRPKAVYVAFQPSRHLPAQEQDKACHTGSLSVSTRCFGVFLFWWGGGGFFAIVTIFFKACLDNVTLKTDIIKTNFDYHK